MDTERDVYRDRNGDGNLDRDGDTIKNSDADALGTSTTDQATGAALEHLLVLERQLPLCLHDATEHAEWELSEWGLGDQLHLGKFQCGREAGGGHNDGELLCDQLV
jgi:hypothetical protein